MDTLQLAQSATVTVLLPVYNGQQYLAEAIDSILGQTYSDFELLIIDDGSTDLSVDIIQSYEDQRIRLIKNPKNLGLIATLNLGIKLAAGKYIARMDNDDISLPTRLAEQVTILTNYQSVVLVASTIELIDSSGKATGKIWAADRESLTMEDISQRLPIENCIAHPSVMVRSDVLRKFGYSPSCKNAEDYDLWLRMVSAGLKFHKIMEPLLLYRIHAESVTAVANVKRYDLKNIRVKLNFLTQLFIHPKIPSIFDKKVISRLCSESWKLSRRMFIDYAKGGIGLASRYFGRFCGLLSPKRNESELFFFFPVYHIGGSEKVHADILQSFSKKQPTIVLTGQSKDETFKKIYAECGRLVDISGFLKYFFGIEFMVGYWATSIGRCKKPVILGSNNGFYYYLLRYIKPHVYACDLLHAFGAGFEYLSLPVVARIDKRIVISEQTVVDLKKLYHSKKVKPEFVDRIQVIENCVDIPDRIREKGNDSKLHILYVGRGGAEKRIHLIAAVASECARRQVDADFTLIGDVDHCLTVKQKKYCKCVGSLSDPVAVAEYYHHADVLMITSIREGFPVVVMECMAHGVVPICTDVGGIHVHVRDDATGFLVLAGEDDSALVGRFVAIIEKLCSNRQLLQSMSSVVHEYAERHFNRERFVQSYEHELQRTS